MSSYAHLLSPGTIGGMSLRNRIVQAPMGLDMVEADGVIREPTLAYYGERARGGVGLIITENTAAAYPRGANSAHEIGVSDDSFLPGLTALADAVHEHGGKIAIQLAHHGKVGRLDTIQGRELLMPSKPRKQKGPGGPLDLSREEIGLMMEAAGGGVPKVREATKEDLKQLVAEFADAAKRARRAGFDAVELHGAHGYIFSEFLSPAWNFREDEYGGDVDNRSRLLCEVIRACKEAAGADFPIWCRLDGHEFDTENGIVVEDAARTAELAEQAGADAIHVSAYGNPMGAGFTKAPIVHSEGGFVDFASRVKQQVNVPVISSGRIEPEVGDELIRDGRLDFVSMGRKLLAEPALPAKLAEGRPDRVRPCVYCYVCVAQPFFDKPVRCSVNPMVGFEQEFAEKLRTKVDEPRRIVVVGGGPAGLEAASIAAMRGHDVTLFEKSGKLGGTLRFAAIPYEPNERLLRWLEVRAKELPITLRLDEEATPDAVRALSPDHVLVATGALREKSAIPGADLPHVQDGDALRDLLTGSGAPPGKRASLMTRAAMLAGRATGIIDDPGKLRRASRAWMPLGKRIAIVGGGLVGCELAEFLAERGRDVTVVEEGPVLALEMAHPRRWRVLHDLRETGVTLEAKTRVAEITKTSIRTEKRNRDGEVETAEVPIDDVVIATGLVPNPDLGAALASALDVKVEVIGDATGVSYIEGAIHEGFRAAMAL